jgi:hypothetical protein
MEKQYNDCNDVEKHIVREHSEWADSTCDYAYKFEQLMYWRGRARNAGIEHLLITREK